MRPSHRVRIALGAGAAVAVAIAVGVIATGDSDDGPDTSTTTLATEAFPFDLPDGTIGAHQNRFGPDPTGVTVEVGDEVVFRNTDTVAHTFTADDGLFDSGVVEPGESYDILLNGPRTVTYHCEIHPAMRGEFTVE